MNKSMTEEENEVVEEDGKSIEIENDFETMPDDELGNEEEEEEEEESSAIAQKKKYREKLKGAKERIKELETAIAEAKKDSGTSDEKEKAAREYIRKLAREEMEAREKEQELKEKQALLILEEKISDALDEYPQFTEKQLLDVIKDYGVEPEAAAKILLKQGNQKPKPKPNLPTPKRGSTKVEDKIAYKSGKSMYQIAQDLAESFRKKS